MTVIFAGGKQAGGGERLTRATLWAASREDVTGSLKADLARSLAQVRDRSRDW